MKPTLVLRPRRSVRVGVAMTAALAVAVTTAATYPAIADPPPVAPFDATVLEPVDQQVVTRLEEFSWDDYNPLPATYDWANDYTGTEAAYKGALVIIDFPDQPFMVTQDPAPAGAELTGADRPYTKITRDQVPQYYANLLNTPSALNHGRTVNEYWMEQSGGRLSLDFTTFGPYTMPYSRAVYGMYDDGNNFSGYSNSAKLDPFGNNRDSHGATGNNQFCPWFTGVAANATTGYSSQQCNRSHRTDALALWRSDLDRRVADPVDPLYGAYDNLSATAKASNNRPLYLYDMVFYVLAGRDESSTWEEFGRAIFTQDPVTGEPQVPNSFGPPRDGSIRQAADGTPLNYYGDPMANWSKTRYIPWTSWIAASNQWPNASFPNPNNGTIGYAVQAGNSLQSESSGMGTYAHEFSHIRGISDNYGNPFDVITGFVNGPTGPLRDTSGPFDILSRGSSLGPEGMHQRWHVPSTTGGSQPAGVPLRDRIKMGIISPENYIDLPQATLDAQGTFATTVTSRAVMRTGDITGFNVQFDAPRTGEVLPYSHADASSGTCKRTATSYNTVTPAPPFEWDCDGGQFQAYAVEVVDQMGTDSFAPDHGIYLTKTKTADSNPFIWQIDANLGDIGYVDYVDADGNVIPVTRGDQRQMDDGLFHAGTNSGSKSEYVDPYNELHFYFTNAHRDAQGILQYDVAVRSLRSSGPQLRGVEVGAAELVGTGDNEIVRITVPVKNTGGAVVEPTANSDVYRIAAEFTGADSAGWELVVPEDIEIIPAGGSVDVVVYAHKVSAAASLDGLRVKVSATSENNPAASDATSTPLDAGAALVEALRSTVAVYALFEAQEALYKPVSYAPLAQALADARVVIGWGSAPAATVAGAIAALESAAAGLVLATDVSTLNGLIAKAEAVLANGGDYVAANLQALRDQVAAARSAAGNPDVTDAQVLAASVALAQALSAVLPKGDTAALAALVAVASALDSARYTPVSWAGLAAPLAAARAVLLLADPSVYQVQDAFDGLSAAVSGLALASAKSGLKTAIDVGVAIGANLDAYYPASVAGFAAALSAAQAVYADPNATQDQVTAAQAGLIAAIANVRLKAAGGSAQALPLAVAAKAALAPAAVAAAAPAKAFKAVKPIVKGKAKVGGKLTAKAGAWSGSPDLSYQWYRGGKAIAKAVKPTYKVKKADLGKRLQVKVTASKAGYTTKAKTSAKTKPVK